jgi:hypothetical protein
MKKKKMLNDFERLKRKKVYIRYMMFDIVIKGEHITSYRQFI